MGSRNEENVGHLEALAAKRKARLLELRKIKGKTNITEDKSDNDTLEELPTSQVLFRNYQPTAAILEATVLPQVEPTNIEELVKDQLQYSETKEQITEVEMSNLAPKKITYDLRRSIQSKLDKLEKRTDKAIAELIRERLKEGKQLDIIIGASLQEKETYGSDDD